jgi:hypothetical protein
MVLDNLARDPDAGRDSSDQCIGMAREGSDFSAGLGAVEPSIRVSPRPSDFKNDQVANDRPSIGRRTFRTLARFTIAALIGVGASLAWQSHGDEAKEMVRTWTPPLGWLSSAWQSYGDEAKEMVRTWTPSLGWLSSVSTTKSPPDVDVAAEQTGSTPSGQVSAHAALPQPALVTQTAPAPAAAATSELVQQLKAIARDLAVVRHSVEQLAAKQEQMAHNIATLQAVDQDVSQKMSSPPLSGAVPIPPRKNAPRIAPLQPAAQSSSVPRPADPPRPSLPPARTPVVQGWTILDARGGYVYVENHGDVYQVVLGTPLPGLGPVESVKRQDGRWMVLTPKGIIVSMRDRRYFEAF